PPSGLQAPPLPAPSAASPGTTTAPSPIMPPPAPAPTAGEGMVGPAPVMLPPGSAAPDAAAEGGERPGPRPPVLRPPDEGFPTPALPEPFARPEGPFFTRFDPPMGYTGRSGVLPTEVQTDPHFVPVEDRWRTGYPEWDRYDKGHPILDDYPYQP